ncbi:MAG: hypothetical protein AAB605_00120 [Patescibacteria group bacterium]
MTKTLGILAALIILAVGGYFFFAPLPANDYGNSEPAPEASGDSSAMRAEENMVVVSEQRPGMSVTGSIVYLAAAGYLVIHEDGNGSPGAILGASALLPAGESSNVRVTLSRAARDGETLHAMLHFEKGGNTTFSAAEDTPVQSVLGGPISGWFEVSSDAPLDVPISI